ncbi:MAG: hypothetical protein J6T64_10845 [Bacteroidaceae bacterium]|nr:hypothetical protein [Bacteroidaceae bacterium]
MSTLLCFQQIDIDDLAAACTSFGNTGIVTHLYFADKTGLQLGKHQSGITTNRYIVDPQLIGIEVFVTSQQVIESCSHHVRTHLQNVQQCFLAVELHQLGIDDRTVTTYLDDSHFIIGPKGR